MRSGRRLGVAARGALIAAMAVVVGPLLLAGGVPRTTAATFPDWGIVLVPAATWDGVDVYSNGPDVDYLGPDDGYGYAYQCVELVQRFYAKQWGYASHWPVDDADQVWDATGRPDDIVAIPNGSKPGPRWGDVLVFGPDDASPSGHVAIVTGVSRGRVAFVEQNYSRTGRVSLPISAADVIDPRGRPPVLGWLHSPRNHGDPRRREQSASRASAPAGAQQGGSA